MRLDLIYAQIATERSSLLYSFTNYLCAKNHLMITTLKEKSIASLKEEIRYLLKSVRYSNIELVNLEMEIERETIMIECFRRSFVSGDGYDSVGKGKDNGLIRNTQEERAIKKIQMEEEQMKRYAKRDMLKKSLDSNNQLILNVVNLIPNELYRKIVVDLYITDLARTQIANKYCVAYDTVGCADGRGLQSLAQIYKLYLENLKIEQNEQK